MKNINNCLNTNNNFDDSAKRNNNAEAEIDIKLKTHKRYFFAKGREKCKQNRKLWKDVHHNKRLSVDNFIKKELDKNQKRYPNEYVYIFKLSNNYFKIKFVYGKIKVLSAHKDN